MAAIVTNVDGHNGRSAKPKTVNGEKLTIGISPDKTEVEGSKVYRADVSASNGIMYSIGKVPVPKSLVGFAVLKNGTRHQSLCACGLLQAFLCLHGTAPSGKNE